MHTNQIHKSRENSTKFKVPKNENAKYRDGETEREKYDFINVANSQLISDQTKERKKKNGGKEDK